MREISWVRTSGLIAVFTSLVLASGCVLVVGADGAHRRGDVEWETSWNKGSRAAEHTTVDGSLAREVTSRIRTDGLLAAEDITVSSVGSVVTLHGRVGDLALLEHAMHIAVEVPDVTRVVSRVTVELEGS
jgi:osmotically-inducible protein OsmY